MKKLNFFIDEHSKFWWRGTPSTNYNCFILNGGNDLKWVNAASFEDVYSKPMFQTKGGSLVGVNVEKNKALSLKLGVYGLTEKGYRRFIHWLDFLVIGDLSFKAPEEEDYYYYRCKVSSLNTSTKYTIGYNGIGEEEFYAELDITWTVQGENIAYGRQNEWKEVPLGENNQYYKRLEINNIETETLIATNIDGGEGGVRTSNNIASVISINNITQGKYVTSNYTTKGNVLFFGGGVEFQDEIEVTYISYVTDSISDLSNEINIEFSGTATDEGEVIIRTYIAIVEVKETYSADDFSDEFLLFDINYNPLSSNHYINLTYKSEAGILLQGINLLSLKTFNSSGGKLLKSFIANRYQLPGLFEDEDSYYDAVNEKYYDFFIKVEKNNVTITDFNISSQKKTNII